MENALSNLRQLVPGLVSQYFVPRVKNIYQQYVRSPQGEMFPQATWKKTPEERQKIWSDFFQNAVVGATSAPGSTSGLSTNIKPKTFYEALKKNPTKLYSETGLPTGNTFDLGNGVKAELTTAEHLPNGTILDSYSPGAKTWYLERISSEAKGKGNASKALDKLLKQADEYGITLKVQPHPYGKIKGLNTEQLQNWYAKRGFVPDEGIFWKRDPSIFSDKTGMPNYDALLDTSPLEINPAKTIKQYYAEVKGKVGNVVYMSPDEYLSKIPKDEPYKPSIERMKGWISEGKKIEMPMLDYSGGGFTQEGRNRAYLAKELGIPKMPVLIVNDFLKGK